MSVATSELKLLDCEMTVEMSRLENSVEGAGGRIKLPNWSLALSVLPCRALSWHELCQKRRRIMDG